jgi:glycyl-tRNA synthetase beta chain
LPRFIAVRSGGDRALDTVREGNERVLSARFNDARFFYQQDRETPLAIIGERLGRILFQEKLGTLAEKRWRLELLVRALVDSLGWAPQDRDSAVRAATLCKADLASQMVTELPALQGVIGREYALAAGERTEVADAIAEHYKPRSAGDTLPKTRIGNVLALADRLDTLVGYVGLGIQPTGSSDPFGLRRAAQGVIQILANDPNMLPLLEIELYAVGSYREANGIEFNVDEISKNLGSLFDQRMTAFLQDRGIRYDLIDAALSGGATSVTLVHAVIQRAETLRSLESDEGFIPLVTVAGRVSNILRGADRGPATPLVPRKEGIQGSGARTVERAVSVLESESRNVEQSLLTDASEEALYAEANRLLPKIAMRAAEYDFQGLYHALQPLRPTVDKFFDDVLVMVDDPTVRKNRLALLCFIDALYKTLADFTKVVVSQ